MHIRSLKTRIIVDVAFLLLAAICLTDFLLIRIIEKRSFEIQLTTAQGWLRSFSDSFMIEHSNRQSNSPDRIFNANSSPNNIISSVFLINGTERIFGPVSQILHTTAVELNQLSVRTGRPIHRFIGDSWGVFWKSSKYLVISIPLTNPADAGAAVIHLEPFYRQLRDSQQIVIIYLMINFFLFFCIGTFRLTRLITRPIHRFIKMTDAFQFSDRFELYSEKQNDEFGRLSSALNRMMQRIDQDQHRLQLSLERLEKTNSELKQTQQEMIRAEKLASVGRLSAGIAHEIGNPIGIVLGYLGLLRTRTIPPEDTVALDYIARAESEIQRINMIIRQLLDFSRSTVENYHDVSVHELIRDVGNLLSEQPFMNNIRIGYELSVQNDRVHCDYNQLRQVLVNLMINAADSITDSENSTAGEIRFLTRIQPEDRSLLLTIIDNGCGISEDQIEKIFDPFFTTKAPGKGTGLGLSVSYMIIKRFGGHIEVKSAPGEGTTMVISLPLAHREEAGTV